MSKKDNGIIDVDRIAKTLQEHVDKSEPQIDDSYYVYMLATIDEGNPKPFYIGKGKDTRVFQHEKDAVKIIEAIKSNTTLIDEESEKIKKIVENKNDIEKYIIKWGLTEQEAFMCESSLINMYKAMEPEQLTNIQNGHASTKEKESRTHTTKAYEIAEFQRDVCIESVNYYNTDLKKFPVMFIDISETMKHFEKDCNIEGNIDYDEYVYQSVQGYWHNSLEKAKKAEFVVALQNSIIRGIYLVNQDCWWTVRDIRNKELNDKIPQYPRSIRMNYSKENGENFLGRIWFTKTDRDIPDNLKILLNQMITESSSSCKKDWFKEQNSRFNYDVERGKLKLRTNLRINAFKQSEEQSG